MLKFAVLGEVRAWRDELELDLGSKQRRALLAALLLRSGRSATVPELIDGVWGEHPTPSAIGALRNHILHLRRALEPERPSGAPATVLVGFGGGYALRLAPGAVDVEMVEDMLLEVQPDRIGAEPSHAVELVRERLDAALRLWSGTPLAGLPGPYADRQRTQLIERRVALLEQRIELDLRLGRYPEVIAELTPLCAEHPMREQIRGLLMTALYHAGRQAEALAVYADTRKVLIERLGIEPGQQLAELHQRILRADLPAPQRDTDKQPVIVRPPRRAVARVAQLPADVVDFTGRTETVRRISEWLTRTDGFAVPVCVIGGMGGIGKSALAVHVGHRIREHFPDGQLHVDLHGFAQARGRNLADRSGTPAADTLGDFLRALGIPEGEIAPTLAERSAQFRSFLDGKRVLVVLDNARDVDQVAPLIPGTPGSAVLITSRSSMPELPCVVGVLGVRLDVLARVEARTLLAGIAGLRRVAAEPAAVDSVLTACGGLPLAVRIVGARLAARPNWSISSLAERLDDEKQRLGTLRSGDLAVEAAFRLSYDQLDCAQARAFRMLAVPEVAEISLDAAAAILGADRMLVEELCESLVDLNLMETSASGRYTYHDLPRLFARELHLGSDVAEPVSGALLRLLDFYLATMKNLMAVCNPGSRLPEHLGSTAANGLSFMDSIAAQYWLDVERPNLISLYEQTARVGGPALARAADIAWATAELIDGGPHCQELSRALSKLLDAAVRAGDRGAECRIRVTLGAIFSYSLGTLRQGRDHQRIALSLPPTSPSDVRLVAFASQLLSSSTRMGTETAASVAHAERAIRLARQVEDPAVECASLVHMSKTLSDGGQFEAAQDRATEAKTLAAKIGNAALEAMATHELGVSLGFQGDHAQAIELCGEAVQLARLSGVELREGWALARLAHVHMMAGQLAEAEPIADAAVRLLNRQIGPLTRARVLVMHGLILQALGRTHQAYCVYRCAAEAFAPMEDAHFTHERLDHEVEAPILALLAEHLDEVIAERNQRRDRAAGGA
ncbi:AfsR/SARP family transcriptional regulator [Nocardia iowensis]|uniref:Winged helix-turn-helix domain-containing protein n=1 Tax=Nocardia iowensis TaxID=204891 RepID=A0ABX8RR50_NOCIO|nr:BTAD domain-containing putative transcriptional regulator [Nocardia iowensis]QXN92083.1 winged helix-turn-helix domain-containing protein [Nocardia iowensis]